jgi:hypothetical protein
MGIINYFENVFAGVDLKDRIQAVRTRLRQLVKQYHPDLCSEKNRAQHTEITKIILGQYAEILQDLSGKVKLKNHKSGKAYTYKYNETKERQFTSKLYRLFSLLYRYGLTDPNIEIIGSWIWVWCSPTIDLTSECSYSKQQQGYYYFPGMDMTYKRRNASGLTRDQLRSFYGSHRVSANLAPDTAE